MIVVARGPRRRYRSGLHGSCRTISAGECERGRGGMRAAMATPGGRGTAASRQHQEHSNKRLSAWVGKFIHKRVGKIRAQRFTTISPLNWMGASRGERHTNQADMHHDLVITRNVRGTYHGVHVRTRCKLAACTPHALELLNARRARARNMGHMQCHCSIGGVSPGDRAVTIQPWRDMT